MRRVREWRAVVGCCAAVLAGWLAACGASESRPRDVVLITIDTLRPDHLGIYGYPRETSPRIDESFGAGRIFERSYSAEAHTSPSVASIGHREFRPRSWQGPINRFPSNRVRRGGKPRAGLPPGKHVANRGVPPRQ